MIKIITTLLFGFYFKSFGNNIDSLKSKKLELFNSGFLDIMNSGQVNSSARFLKLNIGEPNKFYLPLSLYGGVSSNPIQGGSPTPLKTNEHLVTGFINPLSGLINFSFEDILFAKRNSSVQTKFGWSYQIGERVMNGVRIDSVNKAAVYNTINFLNTYGATGLYFQTQAWERNKENNLGIFWSAVRLHATRTGIKQLNNFLPTLRSDGIYTGYSVGFGVHITNSVDIRAIYYNYIKKPEIQYYSTLYQLSLNYTNTK
jgi:hypothetical protein